MRPPWSSRTARTSAATTPAGAARARSSRSATEPRRPLAAGGVINPEEKTAREFVSTFNRSELDAFVGLLDPEVEIHGMRGLKKGREEARAWATKTPGGVQQTVLIESCESAGDRVLLAVKREWRWEEDDELAYTDHLSWLFEIRDGQVLSWRPFEDRQEAEAAFTT